MIRGRLHRHRDGGDRERADGDVIEIAPGALTGVFAAPRWLRDLGWMSWLLVGVAAFLAGSVWLLALTQTIVLPVIVAAILAGPNPTSPEWRGPPPPVSAGAVSGRGHGTLRHRELGSKPSGKPSQTGMSSVAALSGGSLITRQRSGSGELSGATEPRRDGPATIEQLHQRVPRRAPRRRAFVDELCAHAVARGHEPVLVEHLGSGVPHSRLVRAEVDEALHDRGEGSRIDHT